MTVQDKMLQVEVQAEDLEDLEALYADLRGACGISAELTAAPVQRDELGAVADILTVALTSGAVTAFLQVIRTVAESRGPAFVLKVRKGRDKVEIAAHDPEKGLEALKDLLNGT